MTERMTDRPWIPDDHFLERVRKSYRQAIAAMGLTQGMWQDIDVRRADIHAALVGDDLGKLRDLLADPMSTDLYYGVDGVCRSIFGELQNDQSFRNDVTTMLQQRLPLLFITLTGSPDIVFDKLDAILGHKVEFPSPFRGEMGLPTERGLATERAIAAIYQASLLLKFANNEPGRRSVVEIGPGMGRTIYYSYRSGFTDYTTIDLPMGVVAQSCFLAATLGPDAIWLSGDDPQLMNGRIKLLYQRPERNFDIAMNVDSIPEMSLPVAFKYVSWINEHARRFVSINHELNPFTVAELGAACLPVRPVRTVHPMRADYFEEIFDIPAPRSPQGAEQRLKRTMLVKRIRNAIRRLLPS